jgi:hypothetical protein
MILFCFGQCSAPVKLTKAYDKTVEVVKYIFYSHVVFHYNFKNTISDKLLENVMALLLHVTIFKICFSGNI